MHTDTRGRTKQHGGPPGRGPGGGKDHQPEEMLLRFACEVGAQGAQRPAQGDVRGPDPRLTSTLALGESKMGSGKNWGLAKSSGVHRDS